jgi:hypothetical protein
VKRRDFITLLGGAATWPLAAHAQRARRIGVLMANPGIGEEQEAFLLLPLGLGKGAAASCTRKSIAVSLRCGGGHGNDEGGLLGEYVEKYRVMVISPVEETVGRFE